MPAFGLLLLVSTLTAQPRLLFDPAAIARAVSFALFQSPSLVDRGIAGAALPYQIPSPCSLVDRPSGQDFINGLSPAQMKFRVERSAVIPPPGLYSSLRIANQTLVFQLEVSKNGRVARICPQSGYPLILPVAIDSLRKWRFRRMRVRGRAVAYSGTLVLVIDGTDRGLKTDVVASLPERL